MEVLGKQQRDKLKRSVRQLELKNYSKLILFRTDENWYKIGDHSMLIYKYLLAPKLHIEPNLQPDTDYTRTIFEDGLITFHGLEVLTTRLKSINQLRELKETENSAVIELNLKVSERDLKEFRKRLIDENERALKTIRPKVYLEPEIYSKLRHIQKRVFEIVRKMTPYEREYNGALMDRYAHDMTQTYFLMNIERTAEDAGWEKLLKMMELLIIEVNFAVELKYVDQNVGVSLSEEMLATKRRIEQTLNRYRKENVSPPVTTE